MVENVPLNCVHAATIRHGASVFITCGISAKMGKIYRLSNHAEVNHHHGNARVHANCNFATRLRVLIQLVMGNMEGFNVRLGRQLREHQRKLEIELRQSTREIDQDASCKCKAHERNELMFECEGFCLHTCQIRTLQRKSEHMIPEWLMHGPPTRVELSVEEEIWRLIEHQETGSSVMCEAVSPAFTTIRHVPKKGCHAYQCNISLRLSECTNSDLQ